MENLINDNFVNVSFKHFIEALKRVQERYSIIRKSTTPWKDIENEEGSSYYLAGHPGFMGFALSANGELTSVFSAIRGKGDILMKEACKRGACHLDCFDGYLPKFYERHGFQVVRREANWTPGEPDVCFMERV
jgi:hypothetical protein